jgi:hypothetical protein
MDIAEVKAFVSTITYKPGYKITHDPDLSYDLKWRIETPQTECVITGRVDTVKTWVIITTFYNLNKSYIVELFSRAIKNLENHESMEWFKVEGKWVKNPHPELSNPFNCNNPYVIWKEESPEISPEALIVTSVDQTTGRVELRSSQLEHCRSGYRNNQSEFPRRLQFLRGVPGLSRKIHKLRS